MDIVSVLLIFFILIVAFYLVKIKIDEGTISEKEKNKVFKDEPINTSSIRIRKVNNDNKFLFYINRCFSNYANFDGTATRSEFWYFFLFTLIIGAITFGIDFYFFSEFFDKLGIGLISSIASLFIIVPQLSLSSRRLHDIGKSGWWILIGLTVIGIIVLYVWYATKSNLKLNKKYK
jgi:uncharacterized membrane protein YhaH (DUF805 family)